MARNTSSIPAKTTGRTYTAAEFEALRGFVDSPSQSLGAFTGSLIVIDGSGYFTELGSGSGNISVTFSTSGHNNENVKRLTKTFSGSESLTITKPSGINLNLIAPAGFTNGDDLSAGKYKISFVYESGEITVIISDAVTEILDISPLTTPTGLSARITLSSSIVLEYDSIDANADNVLIQRSTTSGSGFSTIATIDSAFTEYEDTTVVDGTTYYYRIIATAITGYLDSSPSTEASKTALDNKVFYTTFDDNDVAFNTGGLETVNDVWNSNTFTQSVEANRPGLSLNLAGNGIDFGTFVRANVDYVKSASAFQSTIRSEFSIVFLLHPNDGIPANFLRIMGAYDDSTLPSASNALEIALTTEGKIRSLYKSGGVGNLTETASAVFTDGFPSVFIVVGITYSESGNKIYIDGSEVALDGSFNGNMAGVTMVDYTSTTTLALGGANEPSGLDIGCYDGFLSNVAMISRNLTAQEMDDIAKQFGK